MEETKYDLIVVGLGCAGLSTAYYAAKKGMKVLGIEMNESEGAIGGSSTGYTRIWRTGHTSPIKDVMMEEAYELWKELERDHNEFFEEDEPVKLLYKKGALMIGHPKHPDYPSVFSSFDKNKFIKSSEIMKRYPGLKNIPEESNCYIIQNAGVVKSKDALTTARKLLEKKYDADLKFNTKATDVTSNSVKIESGEIYNATYVVVATGPYTSDGFDKSEAVASSLETETLPHSPVTFTSNEGLPPVHIELLSNGTRFYSLQDGADLTKYKIGILGPKSISSTLKHIRNRMPDKVGLLEYGSPCFFTMVEGGDFQYKTSKEGIHFVYGFSGQGFKFMPLHGKVVYHGLLKKEDQKYIPDCYRAKI